MFAIDRAFCASSWATALKEQADETSPASISIYYCGGSGTGRLYKPWSSAYVWKELKEGSQEC